MEVCQKHFISSSISFQTYSSLFPCKAAQLLREVVYICSKLLRGGPSWLPTAAGEYKAKGLLLRFAEEIAIFGPHWQREEAELRYKAKKFPKLFIAY